ncbi:Hpt domain-containing protein, partial [Polaromonas sp.]|uniref:Hpt domain-containing protein n=1 Tax=Polaromonas sp. TaxID=1869339 RepID=UPI00286C093D
MQSTVPNSTAADPDFAFNDLGPLAWVLDELRKSLDGAARSIKRFVREAEVARGSDLAAVDASQLRIARQQLHQAVGALEMVGLAKPALLLRAMEAAVQKFVLQPEQCSQDAAARIERASFALTEYLEGVLADKPVSPVSLFPQFREVQELVRADRIHPADLWPLEWRWLEPELAVTAAPRPYDAGARAELDPCVLQLMKGKAPQAAQTLKTLSLGFSAGQLDRQPRIFWKIAAAYFEAVENDLLAPDVYVKRAASRILLQYAALAKGDSTLSERLAQDLLFFCAQAASARASDTPVLSAVRGAYGLTQFKPVDYEIVQFGRFDPALLAQARKRITSAKETWSSLSAGDGSKLKSVTDQFSLVTDSLLKLHPPSEPLAQALTRAVDTTVRTSQSPRIELAMEVATSLLFLEAAFEDLDPNDSQLAARTANLAERLEGVREGGQPQPLEGWMEDLYRRVSDKQTMGSVVGELRVSLGEIEKSLDLFFRNPADKTALHPVPGQMAQMRGVLSVLGLDLASRAVLRMRGSVEQMLANDAGDASAIDGPLARNAGTFEQIGNNLGALSFLIDMLNYQPVLAKKLFVYDEEKGELKPLMGRVPGAASAASRVTVKSDALSEQALQAVRNAQNASVDASTDSLTERLDALAVQAALAEQPALARSAREAAVAVLANNADATADALNSLASSMPAPAPVASEANQPVPVDYEEDDLRDIFLEEAREVVASGQEALAALADDTGDVSQLTVLRRAFHTLKGSSRMVGLNQLGEAAWSFEQMLNSWLADQKPVTREFMSLVSEAMSGFARWVDDIAANQHGAWLAADFQRSTNALLTRARYLPIGPSTPVSAHSPIEPVQTAAALDLSLLIELEPDATDSDTASALDLADATAEPALEFDLFLDAVPLDPSASTVTEGQLAAPAQDIEEIDFDSLFDLPADFNPAVESTEAILPVLPEHLPVEAAPVQAMQLSDADFDRHFKPEEAASVQAQEPVVVVSAEPPVAEIAATLPEPVAAPVLAAAAADSILPVDDGEDEQIKVIGGLRIGIPLYNVYLNEADEWSRRLVTEVAEWAIERDQPVNDSTVALAHSLAGSSATVGFHALSEMARALEHALQQSRAHHSHGAATYGQVFVDAAEDIRRLLHQFAAGFLKQPDTRLLDRLKQLDFSDSGLQPVSELADADFAQGPGQADAAPSEPAEPAEPASLEALEAPAAPPAAPEPVLAAPARVVAPPVRLVPPVGAPAGTPVAAIFNENAEDDIDAIDAVDPDLFPIFEEEGAELMPQLGGALRQWSARPDNQSARMEVLRALHTLKGSARLAGALRLGEMAHRIESEIEYLGTEAAASQEFEPLLTRFDAMQAAFEALRHADAAAAAAAPLVTLEAVAPTPEAAAPVKAEPALRDSSAVKLAIPAPQAMAMQPLRQAATASIRVRSQLLDRMVTQAGEVMITRSRLEAELGQLRTSLNDMSGNLNRLRQQLRDIELQAETQMQSRLAQAKEAQAGFDPLEFDRFTRVQELTRMMAESVNDVATVQRTLQRTVEATEDDLIAQARQTRELQRDLLRTRMVEFEGISDRLYRVIRQASKDTGKQVRLDLLGGTIEMDRGMLDRMTPAFEHLLRNCVAHGIEEPHDRIKAGKEPVGLITVHLRHEGNDVSVDFSDDGAGLDLQRIRD